MRELAVGCGKGLENRHFGDTGVLGGTSPSGFTSNGKGQLFLSHLQFWKL